MTRHLFTFWCTGPGWGGRADGGHTTGGLRTTYGGSWRGCENGGRSGGGDSGGRAMAVPRGDGGSSGGGNSDGGRAAPPPPPPAASAPSSRSAAESSSWDGQGGRAVPRRAREDRPPVGQAVPRSQVPPSNIIIGGGGGYYPYYPATTGAITRGDTPGSASAATTVGYDPWYYGGGYPTVQVFRVLRRRLRLKVSPSRAEVFVDGYFVGIVDQFDSPFQRLPLESGPHRIEVREDGFEPLTFEVRIMPGRTMTYSGELKISNWKGGIRRVHSKLQA